MRAVILSLSMMALAAPMSHASPREDAQVIVELTVTDELMSASFEALSELIVGNFQNEAAKNGKILSEDAAKVLGNMMFGEMTPLLGAAMRREMAEAYVFTMTPQALADFRAFLETPSGLEWAAVQPELMRETTKVAEQIALPIATKAVELMNEAIARGEWPPGTLKSTMAEIEDFMGE
ncbi:MAG: DUF2059 domain-containing protein [Hyphomonas sp.]